MKERGKFIVLYGANNLGKTTQAELLINRLKSYGISSAYLKYPIYDLEPTDPRLNGILRNHTENISALGLQKIFAQNRRDYEPTLKDRLNGGEWLISEDYKGTGIAWGLTYGVGLNTLEEINKDLFPEDYTFCFHGKRFVSSIEQGHLHEEGGRWEKSRKIHQTLAKRYGWKIIKSDMNQRTIHKEIWHILTRQLLMDRIKQLE
ncbi:dTMP kinase [Patescibacteria group bacterium]